MSGLYGLVVCGGKSTRMGTDKSMLNYHGQPQRYHLYDMLSLLCERVFISCNTEQAPDIPDKYAVIVDDDRYGDIGPMKALLTAYDSYPEDSFIVVGCDYPYLNESELWRLTKVSLQHNSTTSLFNNSTKIIEPLLTVYQNNIKLKIQFNFNQKMYSLRRVLEECSIHVIEPINHMSIISIDNLNELERALEQIQSIKNKHV